MANVWEFEISGFGRKLYNQTASWNGFTFDMLDERTALIRFDESIDADNPLDSSKIQEKVDAFVRSLRFKYQWNLSWRPTTRPLPVERPNSPIDVISGVAISSWTSAEASRRVGKGRKAVRTRNYESRPITHLAAFLFTWARFALPTLRLAASPL